VTAWRTRVLSPTGAIAAFFVGSIIFGAGGWPFVLTLFAFFVPAVLLSRIGLAHKRALQTLGKEGVRDGAQVLANGGVAALCALLAIAGSQFWLAAFAAALATAAADTFGTEIGTLSPSPPHSILTGKTVGTGLSGGITLLGTLAEIAGAFLVAGVARIAHVSPAFFAVAIGGVAGACIDSLLGASAQALRYCGGCNLFCESERHRCGADTRLVRGLPWLTNDGVNFLATLGGALTAGALLFYFPNFF